MRVHLFPSRTQKLSSSAPTILAGRLAGKIGNANIIKSLADRRGFFVCFFSIFRKLFQPSIRRCGQDFSGWFEIRYRAISCFDHVKRGRKSIFLWTFLPSYCIIFKECYLWWIDCSEDANAASLNEWTWKAARVCIHPKATQKQPKSNRRKEDVLSELWKRNFGSG